MGGGEEDRAHEPGDRRSPAARHPAVEQAAKHQLPRPAAPATPSRPGLATNRRGRARRRPTPASHPPVRSELADRDRHAPVAPTVPGARSSEAAPGENPGAGTARQPIGATAMSERRPGPITEENGEHRQHCRGRGSSQTAGTSNSGRTTRKTSDRPASGSAVKSLLDQWVSVCRQALLTPCPAGLIPRPFNRSCRFTRFPFGELR